MKNRKNSKVSITLPRSGPSLSQRWRVYSIQRSDLSCVQHFKLENSLFFLQHFKLENSSRLSWRSIKKKSADYFSKEIQRNAFRVWMYCRMAAESGSRDDIKLKNINFSLICYPLPASNLKNVSFLFGRSKECKKQKINRSQLATQQQQPAKCKCSPPLSPPLRSS